MYLPSILSHLKQAELTSRLNLTMTPVPKYEKNRTVAPGQENENNPKAFTARL